MKKPAFFLLVANNKVADLSVHSVHSRSAISIFVARCLDSINMYDPGFSPKTFRTMFRDCAVGVESYLVGAGKQPSYKNYQSVKVHFLPHFSHFL